MIIKSAIREYRERRITEVENRGKYVKLTNFDPGTGKRIVIFVPASMDRRNQEG
jgi:hypothetical protein